MAFEKGVGGLAEGAYAFSVNDAEAVDATAVALVDIFGDQHAQVTRPEGVEVERAINGELKDRLIVVRVHGAKGRAKCETRRAEGAIGAQVGGLCERERNGKSDQRPGHATFLALPSGTFLQNVGL